MRIKFSPRKPSRRWLRRIVVAAGASMLLGTLVQPAHAGPIDPWDYRYNDPRCWPKDYFEYDTIWGRAGTCGGIAGNIFVRPTHRSEAAIMADCKSGVARCTFRPESSHTYYGPQEVVSKDYLWNCTSYPLAQWLTWAQTKGTTTSIQIEGGYGGKLKEVFEASFKASYGISWIDHTTVGTNNIMQIEPGHVGWWARNQLMRQVKGRYMTDYAEPHWGTRWWASDVYTLDGPATANGSPGNLIAQQRVITAEEKPQQCPYYSLFVR
ncbi:hypothetical protein OHA27_37270 [Streptomyces sp. NBC_01619]|uniref:hypothetical protein n=1 Tax=Streptomyces sp. NBC_01619 TaxID=2975901 RepID=UPI00225178F6|nr:hypothetical protein [Streptomyces sp. NBC_01619]MCX4515801.1 hypothetical protein [Streptomyces sp. NBC_01619]